MSPQLDYSIMIHYPPADKMENQELPFIFGVINQMGGGFDFFAVIHHNGSG
jgi:hypothetical protein